MSLGLLVFSGRTAFASDQKVIIDPTNKKILVQSGNQTFSSDNLSGVASSQNSSGENAISTSTTHENSSQKADPLYAELKE